MADKKVHKAAAVAAAAAEHSRAESVCTYKYRISI